MNEGAQVLTLCATVRETPPDHKGGYSLGRDELVVEDTDYPHALAAGGARARSSADGTGLRRACDGTRVRGSSGRPFSVWR